ncbi:MAG: single-stranded DNA-binding protein [Bacteroidaceae bacterium]|nr:single-stranded DNA-binding protein [Bacteroidaceae bacterium]
MNKVMLIGNVGREPDIRYVDAGVCVASLVLATTERGYRLQNGTEVPDRTEWHNITLWRGLAETVEKYVHKGDKLYIEGKIHTRSYDDKNGVKRYITEIWADAMEMLTPKAVKPEPAPMADANKDVPF